MSIPEIATPTTNTDYIDRMVVELSELNVKVESITKFIYGNNPFYDKMNGQDQLLMREQRKHMMNYAATLDQRIRRAKKLHGLTG